MLDYHAVKNWGFANLPVVCRADDCMLYALSLGCGKDAASDPRYLQYVYEEGLRVLPTMAVTLGFPGFWMKDPRTGIDSAKLVHGEQRMYMHRPIPLEEPLLVRNEVTAIVDKGPGRGALVVIERRLTNESGDLVARLQQVSFCRGDGGFSSGHALPDRPLEPLPAVPDRTPDQQVTMPTSLDMALLYRLCGDRNPLHADPQVAAAAGFSRPILHGLATFGLAGKTLMERVCDMDASRLTQLSARFTAPMIPGETLATDIWREGLRVHFRCRVLERGVTVLDNGLAEVRA